MHRLKCGSLPLPELYVCDRREDARLLSSNGIPYIYTLMDDMTIIKFILYGYLEKRFPHINWKQVLAINPYETHNVIVPGGKRRGTDKAGAGEDAGKEVTKEIHDSVIADSWREFEGEGSSDPDDKEVSLTEYFRDVDNHVNIEVLQSLRLLPKFMDDIADAIRDNIYDAASWRECYNKRLGACVGQFDVSSSAPNLIILDISGSIPAGISATMLQLIDSMRTQASADLIITGSTSVFYESSSDIPDPEEIRNRIGLGNESVRFMQILRDRIAGKHYGNVISFGDFDCPESFTYNFQSGYGAESFDKALNIMSGTKVDRVLHYHTWHRSQTGYARWVKEVCPDVVEELDCSWCKCMFRS